MKGRAKLIYGILSSVAMLIIILDTKSAASSIQGGIDLCLRTVIPSLFPFFILSGIMSGCFLGLKFSFMTPLRRLCRIPVGTESILLIGMVSGYPIGAQLVTEAYSKGSISKENAVRMLGFCSNAGPAFLFGMLATVFSKPLISWVLWVIHITSALCVGFLLPGGSTDKCVLPNKETVTLTKTLKNAIINIATVCGWVILFRLFLDYLDNWILWSLPTEFQILLSGFIELSNGCILLQQVQNECIRFILAAAMLAFGGLCVAMQTRSVTGKLGTGLYFPGKLLQTLISLIISYILQPILFKDYCFFYIPNTYLFTLIAITGICVFLLRKKSCSIWQKNVV